MWYQFTDTPIFPKVSRLLPPTGGAGGGGAASIATQGYTWQCHLSLTAVRDAPNNVFRFFNDTGFGLQVAVKQTHLVVRPLPNTGDATALKGLDLPLGQWVHLAVTHRALPKPAPLPPTPAVAQQLRRGFAAAPGSTPFPHLPHPGVFVAPAAAPPGAHPPGSISPSSPHPHSRPGKLTLYVDGQAVSITDVPYPSLDAGDHLQCTLGGLYGRLGAFFLFADVLPPATIAALCALGAGHFATPAMHVVNAGLVAVFPPPPSATSAVPPPSSLPSTTASTPTPTPTPASTTRTVARCLLAQSPAQTTHSVCLPYTWPDESPTPTPQGPLTPPPSAPAINQCLHHTLRLDGITVVHRPQNGQTLSSLGGLKLLVLATSPVYHAPAYASDEEAAAPLLLLAALALCNESHAHLLLEVGAAAIKALYLDPTPRRHRTVRLLAAVRRLLLSVRAVDRTADGYHFASFTSALLLDFAFWGKAPLPVQSAAVRLLRLLWEATPAPFLDFASLGVPRLVDNLLVLNARFITLPHIGPPSAASSSLASPTGGGAREELARLMSAASEGGGGGGGGGGEAGLAPLVVAVQHPAMSAEETALNAQVVELVLALARAAVLSPSFERDAVAPFLHLTQCCLTSHAASVEPLLTLLLQGAADADHRRRGRARSTYLFRQQAHYVFLRLLYSDAVNPCGCWDCGY